MKPFVNLHNHTEYSLLDGMCRVKDLVQAAVDDGSPAVALTDHGAMFGVPDFYKSALNKGVKPIIGIEAYISQAPIDKRTHNGKKVPYNHLTLLARNMTGYKNMIKLASIAYERGFYYKPRIDDDILAEHSEGILALSGCMKGAVPELLLREKYDEAKDKIRQYQEIFNGEFYIELQDHGLDAQLLIKERLLDVAQEFNLPLVATNDGHYQKKEHAHVHDVMLCINTGTVLSDEKRWQISNELYYKNYNDMMDIFGTHEEALDNTLKIAEKCNVQFDFGGKNYHLPKFPIPLDYIDQGPDSYLTKLVHDGAKRRYSEVSEEIEERIDYELDVIGKMHFSDYFLVTQDFIQYARDNDIPVGPGRGSAAGSIVAYSLGITDIDPLKYGLIFERFLNPDRVSMPDIDIDFCKERREEVIQYVRDFYGEEQVAHIITFGTMKARGVIRDVGRTMDIPYDEVDVICKLIPEMAKSLDISIKSTPKLKELLESKSQYVQLLEYARVLEGMARHASLHAAGIVIAPEPISNYMPLYKDSRTGQVSTQFSMNHIEDMGLLKMDFLGLRTLTLIKDAADMINMNGKKIDLNEIPMDDKKTFELFADGETIGIFQFESSGMRDYLRKLKPENIDDLIAMNALYRPGPLSMNMVDDYIQRKHGKKKIDYLHPLIEETLKETYGIIVYQEQVMKIAGTLAGFTMGQADDLRKAMGKKKFDLMKQYEEKFVEGSAKNDIPEKRARDIYKYIEAFAGYGFNKSHSACYAVVAYQTAYLKKHYPHEFMAALLSSEKDNSEKVSFFLDECRQMGIPILPPDIMRSAMKFAVDNGKILFGLGAIKNVGEAAIEALLRDRENYLHSTNFYEFCEHIDSRTVNKKVMESLIQAGAFDGLHGMRSQKWDTLEKALGFAAAAQDEREKGQTNIFDLGGDEESSIQEYPELPEVEPWPQNELLAREKEMLGFYISDHPLNKYRDEVEGLSKETIAKLDGKPDKAMVRNGGIISSVSIKQTRRGAEMAFITLEDFSGSIECIIFPEILELNRDLIRTDELIFVSGKTSSRDASSVKIIVEKIIPIESARRQITRRVMIRLTSQGLEDSAIESLSKFIENSPGKCELIIDVQTVEEKTLRMRSGNFTITPDVDTIASLKKMLGKDNVKIAG